MKHKIILYQFETCPFCEKVRDKLRGLGLTDKVKKVNMIRDRNNPERKELARKSGVLTVPVMEIDGEFIGESDVIVKKLQEMKDNGEFC